MSTVISNDPLKETLYEFAIFFGFILLIGVGVMLWRYRKSTKTTSTKKKSSTTLNKKGIALIVVAALFILVCLFMVAYMKRIIQVTDPAIQAKYSEMYDYDKKEWRSGWYKFIFYGSFIVFVLILIATRSPMLIMI